jgi:alpha-tubulin suppressor-like RCC1 family protein
MPFLSQGGCIKDILVTEEELIDRFVGHELWAWGRMGIACGVGDNTTIVRSSPVQTISGGTNWKDIKAGSEHIAAIKTDGTLWLWGHDVLGNNSTIRRSSPVQTISGGTNWRSVGGGADWVQAIKTDGTLWGWGQNNGGKLGNNLQDSVNATLSPVQTIAGGTNWLRVVRGGCTHSAAIKTDGTLWLWGRGLSGGLGNNGTTDRSSPIQTISGGTNWKSASIGRCNSAATKTDGTLWLWGGGEAGAIGDNSIIFRSSPVQTISGGTNWRSVALAECMTAAIKTDGSLWTWGLGDLGRLGNNSTTNRSSPVQTISGGTNWRAVDAKIFGGVAIKTDGTLWGWGSGYRGALGNNINQGATAGSSSPVQTISGGTDWRRVAAAASVTAALCVTEF